MAIKQYGPDADSRVRMQAGAAGNLSVAAPGEMVVAGLAQDEVVAVAKIPAYSLVLGLMWTHAAMGADTSLQFGIVSDDGTLDDDAAFKAAAASTAAGAGQVVVPSFRVTRDCFVVVTQTGTGTAAGTVSAAPLYVYEGR